MDREASHPESLTSRLASAARLRKLLVHRYWTIMDERVYESVKKGLKDFEEFISQIRRFQGG
ncbi:MAG: HepT-like ribonuclease domain-containing protein [Candidatus Bathyarchaeia archaeon]